MDANVTTILIVDYQVLFRQGVCYTIQHYPDEFVIVGQTATGEEAVQLAEAHAPSVIILSSEVAILGGFQILRVLKQRTPKAAIIVVSDREDQEALFYAIKYGASAYIIRNIEADKLLNIVRQVAQGKLLVDDTVLSASVAQACVHEGLCTTRAESWGKLMRIPSPLSPRELEVLNLMAKGNSNKEIAKAMGISSLTVQGHVSFILRKLGVSDRTRAVVYGLHHGWIEA